MAKNKDYFKKLYRLVRILNKLETEGSISPRYLAEEFNVSMRTAQRDIELLNMAEFPLVSMEKGEYRFMPGFSLKKLPITNEEASLLAFTCGIAKEMGGVFKDSFKSIFAKIAAYINTDSPYYAIMPKSVEEVKEMPFISEAENAIEENRKLLLSYRKEGKTREHKICPLKIIYDEGFWYLYAIVDGTNWDVKYRFDKITALEQVNEKFKVPSNLKKVLDECMNIWFGKDRKIKLRVRVSPECAEIYKKRRFFPHQKAVKTEKDGSLIIESKVFQYMEAIPTIMRWIPHLTVISPKELRNEIKKTVAGYLKIA